MLTEAQFERWERSLSPVVPLPCLDELELPTLLEGERLPTVRPRFPRGLPYYNPDGTLAEDGQRGDVLLVAFSLRYRRGVQVQVSTCFFPTGCLDLEEGAPPLLFETMIFFWVRGRERSTGPHRWRYFTRGAAVHGHRIVLATMHRAKQVPRWRQVF